jgi:hypothetical protein
MLLRMRFLTHAIQAGRVDTLKMDACYDHKDYLPKWGIY